MQEEWMDLLVENQRDLTLDKEAEKKEGGK